MVNDIDVSHITSKLEYNEVYLIAQKDVEDIADEEKQTATDLGITEVSFEIGSGVYKNKEDAIAVAKKLIENKPSRKLAVVSAIS